MTIVRKIVQKRDQTIGMMTASYPKRSLGTVEKEARSKERKLELTPRLSSLLKE